MSRRPARLVHGLRFERPERLGVRSVVHVHLVAAADHAFAELREIRDLELAILSAG